MNPARRRVAAILGVAGAAGLIAAGDTALRARRAFMEGERFLLWEQRPDLARSHWEAVFNEHKTKLDRDRLAGRLSETDYSRRLELARVELEVRLAEDPLKYAVAWFKTAQRFSPPPTPWVRRARIQAELAEALWRRKLISQGFSEDDIARFLH